MSFNFKSDEYYKKFIELQEKLRKSEEERLKLEMKFNEMMRVTREEEQMHYRKLRTQYKRFLEEDRRRQERNERILRSLERIESRVAVLMAKTERFKLLRQQYQNFLTRVYKTTDSATKEVQPQKKVHENKTPSLVDDNNDIVQTYLQNLSSHKLREMLRKKEEDSLMSAFNDDDLLYNFDNPTSTYNRANSVADDIMNSIYSRNIRLNSDLKLRQSHELNNNTVTVCKSLNYELGKSYNFGESSGIQAQAKNNTDDKNSISNVEETETDDFSESDEILYKNPDEFNKAKIKRQSNDERINKVTNNISENNAFYEHPNIALNDQKHIPVETEKNEFIVDQNKKTDILESLPQKSMIQKDDTNKKEKLVDSDEKILTENANQSNAAKIINEVEDTDSDKIYVENEAQKLPSIEQRTPLDKTVEVEELIPSIQQEEKNLQDAKKEMSENNYIKSDIQNVIESVNKSIEQPLSYDQGDQGHDEHHDSSVIKDYKIEEDIPVENVPQIDSEQYNEQNQPAQQYEEVEKASYEQHYDENAEDYKQYDENGEPIESYDQKQYMQQYDEHGQLLQYDQDGQLIQQYDENGQLIQQYQEQYDQSQPQYDENGQPIQQYQEEYDQNQYDENGQLIQQYQEQYDQNQPQYDVNGQLIQQYQEQYDQNQPQYDVNGQLIQQYQEQYDQNQPQYDENGQPIQQYDIQYDENQSQYDENGQPVQQYDYDKSESQLQYDKNGQLIQQSYSDQQYYDENYQEKVEQTKYQPENVVATEDVPDIKSQENVEEVKRSSNVMEMLDTDTESIKQDTKVSHDSDFDFSNG